MSSTNEEEPKPFSPLGRVLVTGGCGFLGSHIVEHIISHYDLRHTSVSVLDLRTSVNRFEGPAYYDADLTSSTSVTSILQKVQPDVVIHTASPVFGSGGKKAKEGMWKVNVEGTRNLVEASREVGCKAFVYTSSASVISDCRTDLINADERWSTVRGAAQGEYYTETKAEAESHVLTSNTRTPPSRAFLTTALRPASLFGERDVQFLPALISTLKDNRTNVQLGENSNLFDCTYVGNAAHAHCLAATALLGTHAALSNSSGGKGGEKVVVVAEQGKGVDGEAFMITNGTPVPFWDFTRSVWGAYARQAAQRTQLPPVNPPVAAANAWVLPISLAITLAQVAGWVYWVFGLGEPRLTPSKVVYSGMTRFYSVDKARERLGYVPVWGLEEGIERGVRWFVERDVEAVAKKGQ
ncbi:MAG: erg26, C-3 sterol dehydrogenase [Chrysothrix sp. TS-e1954]|nr:MAG: erg26, C-3 sterol dehydrogenase [Chrysothrix sp. TS-e1954]